MADTKSIPRSEDGSLREERWTKEEAERRMRELLASLPPPPPIEELARQQGIHLPQHWEDLPRWPEDDMEAWDGFDEFLDEFRRDQLELEQRKRREDPDIP
jgi:hypothetical protein